MNKKFKVIIIVLAILISLIFLLPVFYVILASFKESSELVSATPTFLPKVWTWDNYTEAFRKGDFHIYIFNSLYVAVMSTIIMIIVNTMSGYALAKYKFVGRGFLVILILATMMLPLEVIMEPIFEMLRITKIYNTRWALIIPPAASPLGIFIMRQYLITIPDEIIQSARIDGAGEFRIFTQIIVPNAKPVIATLAIFSFMWRWNDYIWPLIAIADKNKYTMQLAISNFFGEYSVDWSSLLAMSTISMIPMLIIFLIFQKQFVQGTTTVGIKG